MNETSHLTLKRRSSGDFILRSIFWKLLVSKISRSNKRFPQTALGASAIVFSPHYDDETLGCGGIIAQKVRTGADIKIAFMTDGSKSHGHLISGDQLKRIRSSEAISAALCLGVKAENVILLNTTEGRLEKHASAVSDKVFSLLEQFKPAEVFIPHAREPLLWSSDHLLTHRIVKDAAIRSSSVKYLYEYPIWYWFHWPWVGVHINQQQFNAIIAKQTFAYRFGLNAFFDFNYHVNIKNVMNQKMNALMQHKSQTTRLIPDERWATLNDIANGDFLRCFFQNYELFKRTSLVSDRGGM